MFTNDFSNNVGIPTWPVGTPTTQKMYLRKNWTVPLMSLSTGKLFKDSTSSELLSTLNWATAIAKGINYKADPDSYGWWHAYSRVVAEWYYSKKALETPVTYWWQTREGIIAERDKKIKQYTDEKNAELAHILAHAGMTPELAERAKKTTALMIQNYTNWAMKRFQEMIDALPKSK